MTTTSPLGDRPATDETDLSLIRRAKEGERGPLEELVRRHQPWIYNIAVRMLAHPQDAEDATQEILIKALTRLSSFEGRSSFRTWLYRLVVNHILNMKRGRVEAANWTFNAYGDGLNRAPDEDLPDPNSVPADLAMLVDEARI